MRPQDQIVVSGAREHNLKDVTHAEGQRRYVESLSAYARQFLGQMDKPDVDSIEGLSPAISIDQKTTSRNPRSTVGTVTEIYDYLRAPRPRGGARRCDAQARGGPRRAPRPRAGRPARDRARAGASTLYAPPGWARWCSTSATTWRRCGGYVVRVVLGALGDDIHVVGLTATPPHE
jgi:hypothetical protein